MNLTVLNAYMLIAICEWLEYNKYLYLTQKKLKLLLKNISYSQKDLNKFIYQIKKTKN